MRYFKDQAAGRATEDVTEQVGKELQGLLDCGAITFPSSAALRISSECTSFGGNLAKLAEHSCGFEVRAERKVRCKSAEIV